MFFIYFLDRATDLGKILVLFIGVLIMVQNKIQIDEKDFEFIKKAYKTLSYKSLSHYMREAVRTKVREDRKRWKALQRSQAMEQIGQGPYENFFENLEGEDFEDR
jgi:Arc/MetJ-type ribon-helix-helix transcriptional regulator